MSDTSKEAVEALAENLRFAMLISGPNARQLYSDADDTLRALSAERDRLREALEFYADKTFGGYDVEITDYGISMSVGEIIKDGGDRARAALSASSDKKGESA